MIHDLLQASESASTPAATQQVFDWRVVLGRAMVVGEEVEGTFQKREDTAVMRSTF